MRKIVVEPLVKELKQEYFNGGAAVYMINGEYYINSQIILPEGSVLRVENGSITLRNPIDIDSSSQQNGIFLLCSNQTRSDNDSVIPKYTILCLTSLAKRGEGYNDNDGKYTPKYEQTSSVFMRAGDYIKNIGPDNFEMRLTANCRILLPHNTSSANLHILSDKVNTIQIDGKCEFQLHAENCKFERIFDSPEGMELGHLINENEIIDDPITCPSTVDVSSRFDNCEIFAEDFGSEHRPPNSAFLSIWATIANSNLTSTNNDDVQNRNIITLDIINKLILHDCIVANMGVGGTVSVDNCTFLLGPNVYYNYKTVHCLSQSRIVNCIFDGRENITGILPLTHDVIDVYNGHDIIIDGCTFRAYSSVGEAGCCMISVKSQYYSNTSDERVKNQESDLIGPQDGVVIRNCYFDLPTFTGSAIEVWNEPLDSIEQKRSLNRQFTLIEGNYMEMPKATAFVNCLRFSDYTTVRNNVGCVNNQLVFVNKKARNPSLPNGGVGLPEDQCPNNKAHNLIIEGNILRYQKYTRENVPDGMLILRGTYIENLVLENNTVEGSLWSMWPDDIDGNLSGTVRVVNNESISNVLFRARTEKNALMPTDVLTFFSGNVSNGKKTDIGDTMSQLSWADGLFFNGRTFFNTTLHRECIFLGGMWSYVDYETS